MHHNTTAQNDAAQNDPAQHDAAQNETTRNDTVRNDATRNDTARNDSGSAHHETSHPAGGTAIRPTTRATVPAAYRSHDEIDSLLRQVSGRTGTAPGEADKRQASTILDDLAEEMIGRNTRSDTALKREIQAERERLHDPGATGSR